MLQQYLPFTVLKLEFLVLHQPFRTVATVLTVYGIETSVAFAVAFVPIVATVLTVYGIETGQVHPSLFWLDRCNSTYRLRY